MYGIVQDSHVVFVIRKGNCSVGGNYSVRGGLFSNVEECVNAIDESEFPA